MTYTNDLKLKIIKCIQSKKYTNIQIIQCINKKTFYYLE